MYFSIQTWIFLIGTMKKQLIYFLFFGCLLMPSVTMADFYLDLSTHADPWTITHLEGKIFTVEVREDGSPVSGQSVTFSVSPDDGIASVSPTSVTTDSNGQAQTTLSLSGDSSELDYTVTAKLDNGQGNVPSYSVPVGVVSDGAELKMYINTLRRYSPGESVAFTFSLRRKDGRGVSGKTVTFSVSPDDGTASVSPTSATTDSGGNVRTKLILGNDASGRYRVTATLDDGKSVSNGIGAVEPSRPRTTPEPEPEPATDLSIVVVHSPGAGNPGDWLTFIVEVQEDERPSSGQTVTFSIEPDDGTLSILGGLKSRSSVTGSNGRVAKTLVLGNDASGTYTVTASAGTASVSRTVTVGALLPLSISISPSSSNSKPGDTVIFTVSVQQNNNPALGQTVTFRVIRYRFTQPEDFESIPVDGTASLSSTSATTDSNGQASTSLIIGSGASGSYSVSATLSDGRLEVATVTVEASSTPVIRSRPDSQPELQQSQPDPPNNAPEFPEGTSTKRSVAENTASGQNIGDAVSATDTDNDALTYTLSGTDAAAFSIVSSTGQLQTKASLDYEKKPVYTVTVEVSDGNGGSDTIKVMISVTDVNDPIVQEPQLQSEPEQNWTIIPFDYERDGVGKVVFSELMLVRLDKYPQWIELYNTTDQNININGWKIVGRYLDDSNTINILESQVISKSWTIEGKGTVLIVSFAIPNSRDRISIGLADKTYALQSTSNNFWNYEGFVLELQDAEGNPIDRIGNLNTENDIVWEIPIVARNKRVSLIRRLKSNRSQEYNWTFGIKEFGWFPAGEVERLAKSRSQYYYGGWTDIGSPGYRTEGGEILPVTLSQFNPRINQEGSVVISWITESEVNNAGFNILRSNAKKGPFVKVNPKLIQGAGTTSERTEYRWTDTTAKPNTVYYYQIEDVSHVGVREQLATVRLRGVVSVKDKMLLSWSQLKRGHQ